MGEARNLKKEGTGKSAIGLVLVAIAVIVLIGLAIWVLTNPAVLANVVMLIVAIVIALIVIGLIIAGVMMIIAVPMYVAKGNQIQDGVDYSIDDVKSVKESSSDDPKND